MHLSHYIKKISLPTHPDHLLLFSCRTGAMALVEKEILGETGQLTADLESTRLLAEADLVVDDPVGEQEAVLSYLDEINRLNPTYRLAVILGLDCNFACTYCYEGTMKGGKAMSRETARELVAFVRREMAAGKKKLAVSFYGGEPLLYPARIKEICSGLQTVAEEKGATFQCSLVTNGSLLSGKTVRELLPFGLRSAKVTLDGPPVCHDLTRPHRSGKATFATIIANLRESAGLIKINIGGNFSRETYQRFPELLEILEREGLGPENVGQINFASVLEPSEDIAPIEFAGGCRSVEEKWLAEASIILREEILRHGYETRAVQPAPCRINITDNLTVNFDGSLYKCPVLIGRKPYEIGDIRRGLRSLDNYHLENWKREEKCRTCSYLPLCFGGCRYMAHQRDGHMARVDCQKTFWDATLEKFIAQDVRYG